MTQSAISLDLSVNKEFSSIALLIAELDRSIQSFTNGQVPTFEAITLRLPPSAPPIHSFYTTVSWLYVCIVEAGSVHFPFLNERANGLRIDTAGELVKFRDDIATFRTVLQHNLKLEDINDAAKLTRCERWFATVLGGQLDTGKRFWPEEQDWSSLVNKLHDQARKYVEINLATMAVMAKDPFANDVVATWALRASRLLPAFKFDIIAQEVATDLGLTHLDVVKVRKVNIDSWNRQLRLLREGADFHAEARRFVESTLLNEAEKYLPINGKDLIDELGLKPGPDIFNALLKARELYRQDPCGRTELLNKLRPHFNDGVSNTTQN